MKTKIKFFQLNTNFFSYSLLAVLMGVFLFPNIGYFSTITEENIINLTNHERIQNNLQALNTNQLLTKAAYQKGQDILTSQTFAHTIGDKKFSRDWCSNNRRKI